MPIRSPRPDRGRRRASDLQLLAATLLLACATSLAGQEQPSRPAPAAPPTAPLSSRPGDVESMDAVVATLYEVISGPAGPRDWDRFRALFVPGARLIPAVPDTVRGGASARVLTVEEYIEASGKYFLSNGFFEREVARRTDAFGNVADLWSVYESRHAADDPAPFQRGINSIQLLKDGDRWWIVTVFWDAERPGNPIPPRYLPREETPAGERGAGREAAPPAGERGAAGEIAPPARAESDTTG